MFCVSIKSPYFCIRFRERKSEWNDLVYQKWESPSDSLCTQYLTLAVLRERERIRASPVAPTAWKKYFEKKLRKYLVVRNKPLTFAPAFQTEVQNKSSLKRLYINKQVVQVYALYIMYSVFRKTKTVNWMIDRFGSWADINLDVEKKYYYNEEFDPGSGWTLATGLTHASRGAAFR